MATSTNAGIATKRAERARAAERAKEEVRKSILDEIDAIIIAEGGISDEQLSELTTEYLTFVSNINQEAY